MGKFVEKVKTALVATASGGMGFTLAGFLLRDWDFSGWQLTQPIATIIASIIGLTAAWIAFDNGQKTREQDKEIYEAKSRAEQERALRERFTSIVELLATDDLTKRESGAYALAELADDWAAFYKDDQKSALREQQVCLNILTSQLRDPLTEDSPSQLPKFKRRVQDIIFLRFTNQENNGPGAWSDLELDLSKSSLYNPHINGLFNQRVSFSETEFSGTEISFTNAQFRKDVDFSYAFFRGYNIIGPKVMHPTPKSVNFNEVHFGDKVIFTEVDFGSIMIINFTKTIFTKELILSQLNTHPNMLFDEVEFRKGIRYASEPELELGICIRYTEGEFTFRRARFNLSKDDPQIKYLKDLQNSFEDVEFSVDFSK